MIYLEKPSDFNSRFEIVSCFVEHDGEFLMLHRHDHKPQGDSWGVPAGKVEQGETADAAMVRELAEETGLVVFPDHAPVLTRTVFVRYLDYDFVYHIYRLTLAESFDMKIEHDAHKGFDWVTPDEALEKKLIPDMDACIRLQYFS
mgnify:CR=1 FL=1